MAYFLAALERGGTRRFKPELVIASLDIVQAT